MKTINLAVTLIIFALTINTYSQFLSGFGLKGGATFSNQSYEYKQFDYKPETKYLLGFNGSLFAEFLNNRNINIVLESGYEQRGYTYVSKPYDEFGNPLPDMDIYERTNYFTTGMMLKLKVPANKVTPYLLIGPKLDILLSYSVKPEDENTTLIGFDEPLKQFKKENYSLNLGAGIEFNQLFPFKTFIEINYSPPVNSSYNGPGLIVKEHYFNVKAGINFIKEKPRMKKR